MRRSVWSRSTNRGLVAICDPQINFGDCAWRIALAVVSSYFCHLCCLRAGPWKLSRGFRDCACSLAVSRWVRGKLVTSKCESTTRGAFPQIQLESATCLKKLGGSTHGERRAAFAEQLAQSARAKTLAQSNLRKRMCNELSAQSNLQRALARSNLRKTLAQRAYEEQLAKTILRTELAQGNLQKATSAEHSQRSTLRAT